ncbi:MAG: molybdopterin molybdotransferase MoeA [Gaiellales bacterium]
MERILAAAPRLGFSEQPVSQLLSGRVLARDVRALVDLPPFPTSAMDGYAVRSADLAAGPVPVAFRVAAGDRPRPLPAGTAAGIATGAPLPDGADAVVPVEDAREDGERLAAAPPRHGAWIRPAGGDVSAGALVAAAGSQLTPPLLAAIAASGAELVRVADEPRLAVVATGSELVKPGHPLEPGQIYESNAVAVAAQARRAGAQVTEVSTVPDRPEEILEVFRRALDADVVVSTGGVSVGPHDHVKPVLERLGVREVFWQVAHKPGKPLWFGVAPPDTLVFGLPGNPVSSLVTFELFVRPALEAMQGMAPRPRPVARLAEAVPRLASRDHAVRCRLLAGPEGMELHPFGAQDSHLIVHAAAAGVAALIDRGDGEAPAGSLVEYVEL